VAYAATWDGVITVPPSKNAVYDEMEKKTSAAASLTDHALIRGDGGAKGIQTTTILCDDSGRMTNPSQPAFLVTATGQVNATGNNVTATVAWGTEIFDRGGNFAANTFTAPITGLYQLNVSVAFIDITSETDGKISLITSNRTYIAYFNPSTFETSASYGVATASLSVLADMDAADTVSVTACIVQGTQIVDISAASEFSGFLVG